MVLKEHQVKITVLKKLFHQEFVDKYAYQPEKWGPCDHFEQGHPWRHRGKCPPDSAAGPGPICKSLSMEWPVADRMCSLPAAPMATGRWCLSWKSLQTNKDALQQELGMLPKTFKIPLNSLIKE